MLALQPCSYGGSDMYVELILNGVVKKLWHYDNADFLEPFCEAGHEERNRLWNKVVNECRDNAGGLLFQTSYEMYIVIRPKVQPKDIDDEEYREFERMLEEKRNNNLPKLKSRFV
jgi:hypothetical protein